MQSMHQYNNNTVIGITIVITGPLTALLQVTVQTPWSHHTLAFDTQSTLQKNYLVCGITDLRKLFAFCSRQWLVVSIQLIMHSTAKFQFMLVLCTWVLIQLYTAVHTEVKGCYLYLPCTICWVSPGTCFYAEHDPHGCWPGQSGSETRGSPQSGHAGWTCMHWCSGWGCTSTVRWSDLEKQQRQQTVYQKGRGLNSIDHPCTCVQS